LPACAWLPKPRRGGMRAGAGLRQCGGGCPAVCPCRLALARITRGGLACMAAAADPARRPPLPPIPRPAARALSSRLPALPVCSLRVSGRCHCESRSTPPPWRSRGRTTGPRCWPIRRAARRGAARGGADLPDDRDDAAAHRHPPGRRVQRGVHTTQPWSGARGGRAGSAAEEGRRADGDRAWRYRLADQAGTHPPRATGLPRC